MKQVSCFLTVLATTFLMSSIVSAQVTAVTVTEDGKVGIGTTSPESVLHLVGGNDPPGGVIVEAVEGDRAFIFFTADTGVIFDTFRNSDGRRLPVLLQPNGGRVGIGTSDVQIQLAIGDSDTGLQQEGDGELAVYTDFTERMRFAKDGKVGIGTTSPESVLHLVGGNDPPGGMIIEAVEEDRAFIYFTADTGVNFDTFRNSDGRRLPVLLQPNGGRVGIGTATPNHPLEMGSGAHVTAAGVWTNASSRALKENIRDLTTEAALATLQALQPVQYNYKVDQDDEYLGFIAEDVPDLIASKDRKGLSPMDVVAVLTKVVQQQQQQIAELKARLDAQQ